MSSYSEAMREFKDRLTSMRLSLQDMVEVLLRGEELFAQLNISRGSLEDIERAMLDQTSDLTENDLLHSMFLRNKELEEALLTKVQDLTKFFVNENRCQDLELIAAGFSASGTLERFQDGIKWSCELGAECSSIKETLDGIEESNRHVTKLATTEVDLSSMSPANNANSNGKSTKYMETDSELRYLQRLHFQSEGLGKETVKSIANNVQSSIQEVYNNEMQFLHDTDSFPPGFYNEESTVRNKTRHANNLKQTKMDSFSFASEFYADSVDEIESDAGGDPSSEEEAWSDADERKPKKRKRGSKTAQNKSAKKTTPIGKARKSQPVHPPASSKNVYGSREENGWFNGNDDCDIQHHSHKVSVSMSMTTDTFPEEIDSDRDQQSADQVDQTRENCSDLAPQRPQKDGDPLNLETDDEAFPKYTDNEKTSSSSAKTILFASSSGSASSARHGGGTLQNTNVSQLQTLGPQTKAKTGIQPHSSTSSGHKIFFQNSDDELENTQNSTTDMGMDRHQQENGSHQELSRLHKNSDVQESATQSHPSKQLKLPITLTEITASDQRRQRQEEKKSTSTALKSTSSPPPSRLTAHGGQSSSGKAKADVTIDLT